MVHLIADQVAKGGQILSFGDRDDVVGASDGVDTFHGGHGFRSGAYLGGAADDRFDQYVCACGHLRYALLERYVIRGTRRWALIVGGGKKSVNAKTGGDLAPPVYCLTLEFRESPIDRPKIT